MNSKARGLLRSIRSDDMKAAAREATRNGWYAAHDGRGHLVMVAPDGRRVRLSSTAFSGPATRAKVEELRRKGAVAPRLRRPSTGRAREVEP